MVTGRVGGGGPWTGRGLTVQWKVAVAVAPEALVAATATVHVPVEVGLPLMRPVEVSIDSPAGNGDAW